MLLSDRASEKLQAWIAPETWYTNDDHDMERFYSFIDAYQRDHGNLIDEGLLREHIIRTIKSTR